MSVETTRPIADDMRAQDAAVASVLMGIQGAVMDLQKRLADVEKQTGDIKDRIRKVC